ncbi:DoxX family protein [Streptomyces sp. NPDC060064]|uniref:DoxX family protein n=1 Tax=Streptomyces sp. NPDC060064 TaxID=3347049 RepID=UPI002E1567D3|nr:DoxX family protein [Streptomyces sp. NBC_01210]
MDVLVLIGRILFCVLFLNSAVGHLTKAKAMAGYAGARGVPAPAVAVPASGFLLLAGGLMVAFGVWADLGALLLVVFLVPTALLMHSFWKETAEESKTMEMVNFFKDLSLAGAALMLLAFFSYVGHDLGLTLTGPLFDIS